MSDSDKSLRLVINDTVFFNRRHVIKHSLNDQLYHIRTVRHIRGFITTDQGAVTVLSRIGGRKSYKKYLAELTQMRIARKLTKAVPALPQTSKRKTPIDAGSALPRAINKRVNNSSKSVPLAGKSLISEIFYIIICVHLPYSKNVLAISIVERVSHKN